LIDVHAKLREEQVPALFCLADPGALELDVVVLRDKVRQISADEAEQRAFFADGAEVFVAGAFDGLFVLKECGLQACAFE
jgi:hypothetical protein